MSQTSSPPDDKSIELDESGNVAVDLPCCHCQYNLRGISPAGACPECGNPIDVARCIQAVRWPGARAPMFHGILIGVSVIFLVAAAVLHESFYVQARSARMPWMGVSPEVYFDLAGWCSWIVGAAAIANLAVLVRKKTAVALLSFVLCTGLACAACAITQRRI